MCIFKNTDQKDICASIVLKADSRPKIKEQKCFGVFLQKPKVIFLGSKIIPDLWLSAIFCKKKPTEQWAHNPTILLSRKENRPTLLYTYLTDDKELVNKIRQLKCTHITFWIIIQMILQEKAIFKHIFWLTWNGFKLEILC